MECTPDGRTLLALRYGQLVLFDLATQRILREWPLDERLTPHRLVVSADGRLAAVADFTDREAVMVFDLHGSTLPRHLPALQCESVAFSPDGHCLAAGHMDDLWLYDPYAGGEPRVLTGHSNTLADAAFSPGGSLLATVSHDRLLKIRRTATGEQVFSIVAHGDRVWSVCFSPDGRTIATAGDDKVVKLWHTATGQPLGTFQPEPHAILKVRFSADGRRLTALLHDGTIVIYDAAIPRSADSRLPSSARAHGSGDTSPSPGLGDLPGS